jgi:hypothetical protein
MPEKHAPEKKLREAVRPPDEDGLEEEKEDCTTGCFDPDFYDASE